jgi:hypothetical protein
MDLFQSADAQGAFAAVKAETARGAAADMPSFTASRTRSHLPMVDKEKILAEHEYDYVIIGAGSAGCVLPDRFSEQASVLLVAGPMKLPPTR